MSPSTPLRFSVVIPTYNRARLIGKTLDTVFAQTYPHFEVVIVDNCSTDDTEKVLAPYLATGKVRFIKHDRNYERARSRNTGLEAATGDYATFLDSDDLMYPDNLRDAADYAARHPDVGCFHSLYELVDGAGKVLHRYRFPSLADPLRAIGEGNFLSCIGDFLRRDVYARHRFDTDPSFSGSEDWEFWLRVVADTKVGRIDKVNSGIVEHGGRTLHNQEIVQLGGRLARILAKTFGDPHLAKIYGPYRRFMEASALIFTAGVANANGAHGEALRLCARAAFHDPGFMLSPRFLRTVQIAVMRVDQRYSIPSGQA